MPTEDACRELLEHKIDSVEETLTLKLEGEARERQFHEVETEHRFSAHGQRLERLEGSHTAHESRIVNLETKDTKVKAAQLDKSKAWIIGALLAAASGWLGLNWPKILAILVGGDGK